MLQKPTVRINAANCFLLVFPCSAQAVLSSSRCTFLQMSACKFFPQRKQNILGGILAPLKVMENTLAKLSETGFNLMLPLHYFNAVSYLKVQG